MQEILSGKNILLVDDDRRNTYALSSYLEYVGVHIHTAENGLQAIKSLEEHPEVSIVLLDMMMPEMDGYETIAVMRGRDDLKHIPIIAVTARAMVGDREKCLEAGADDYVSKPINMPSLLSKMATLLENS